MFAVIEELSFSVANEAQPTCKEAVKEARIKHSNGAILSNIDGGWRRRGGTLARRILGRRNLEGPSSAFSQSKFDARY
jgi:hypothetical protein